MHRRRPLVWLTRTSPRPTLPAPRVAAPAAAGRTGAAGEDHQIVGGGLRSPVLKRGTPENLRQSAT
ncbi:hypothetical protein E4K65_07375 [Bradyrhizobium niftali]|uniref:Uncharacterized protein n=1 Tax=Bradyrhizobium niftali TaxID=2560055 RepID=A0A4Y9M437_9BRAD|nr:hypothetical protein E4K65_07375 [Bradyrhizobium niftali]